jgi:hypothetical protein
MASPIKGKQLDTATITSREAKLADGGVVVTTISAGDTPAVGTSTALVRMDHKHGINTGAASGLDASSTSTEGAGSNLARAAHTHAIDTTNGTMSTIKGGDSGSAGSATGLSRRDHQHGVVTATPVDVGTANAEGSGANVARGDHVHKLSAAAMSGALDSKKFAFGVQTTNFSATGTSSSGAALTKKIFDMTLSKKIGGSAVLAALVTSAPDNVVGIRDTLTNDPIHGVYSDVYGRTTATSTALGGTYTWQGTTTVLCNDTSDVVTGDFIRLTADGQLFEVASKVANTSVTILNPGGLTIPTAAAGVNSSKVALTLSYYEEDNTNTEIAYTFSPAHTIDFMFREAMGLYTAPFGALQTGVSFAEPLPAAHTHTLSTGATDVTATAAELNQLHGISANVSSTNLNTLTAGTSSNADSLHTHTGLVPKSLFSAKGSIISGSATASTPVETVVGTNGQFLKADSTAPGGVSWASPASSDIEKQESLATQSIIGTDTPLTAQLSQTPKNNASVSLFLNGIQQEQGATKDYTISGKIITWLASTGTCVDMETTDSLVACYVQ